MVWDKRPRLSFDNAVCMYVCMYGRAPGVVQGHIV